MSFRLSLRMAIAVLAVAASFAGMTAHADPEFSEVKIQRPIDQTNGAFDQLISLQISQLQPQSARISNGNAVFDYTGASSIFGEAGWAAKLYGSRAGSFYFEEGLGFTSFSGNVASGTSAGTEVGTLNSSYSLYLFALDTRLMYAADWLPVRWIIPFVDGGYQYNVFFQPSSQAEQSVEGGTGNFAASAGLRVWLDPVSSVRSGSVPLFLSAKLNRIFPGADSLNLASTSFMAGLTVGL